MALNRRDLLRALLGATVVATGLKALPPSFASGGIIDPKIPALIGEQIFEVNNCFGLPFQLGDLLEITFRDKTKHMVRVVSHEIMTENTNPIPRGPWKHWESWKFRTESPLTIEQARELRAKPIAYTTSEATLKSMARMKELVTA